MSIEACVRRDFIEINKLSTDEVLRELSTEEKCNQFVHKIRLSHTGISMTVGKVVDAICFTSDQAQRKKCLSIWARTPLFLDLKYRIRFKFSDGENRVMPFTLFKGICRTALVSSRSTLSFQEVLDIPNANADDLIDVIDHFVPAQRREVLIDRLDASCDGAKAYALLERYRKNIRFLEVFKPVLFPKLSLEKKRVINCRLPSNPKVEDWGREFLSNLDLDINTLIKGQQIVRQTLVGDREGSWVLEEFVKDVKRRKEQGLQIPSYHADIGLLFITKGWQHAEFEKGLFGSVRFYFHSQAVQDLNWTLTEALKIKNRSMIWRLLSNFAAKNLSKEELICFAEIYSETAFPEAIGKEEREAENNLQELFDLFKAAVRRPNSSVVSLTSRVLSEVSKSIHDDED